MVGKWGRTGCRIRDNDDGSTFHVSGKRSASQMKSLKHLIRSVIILPSSEGLVAPPPAPDCSDQRHRRPESCKHFAGRSGDGSRQPRKQADKQRQLQAKQLKSFPLITEKGKKSGYAFQRVYTHSACVTLVKNHLRLGRTAEYRARKI